MKPPPLASAAPTLIIEFGEFANITFEGNLAPNGKEISGLVTGEGETWPVTFKAEE